MAVQKSYLFIPDNRPFSVICQYIPQKEWDLSPRLIMYLTSCEATIELNFSSLKGVQLLMEAFEKIIAGTEQAPSSIQTYVTEQN